MPLPHATLSVLQAAGAAIFAADVALKKTADDYSEQVKAAMLQNAYDLGNDGLFENWKTVARLAQAVAQIEVEFRKIYSAAADMPAESGAGRGRVPALGAPAAPKAGALELVKDVQATDVVAKKTRKKRKAGRANAKKASRPPRGNSAKLLALLMDRLNPHEGTKVNWSAVAEETGIPKGSIGAARIKLLQTGHIKEDASGNFRLSLPSA